MHASRTETRTARHARDARENHFEFRWALNTAWCQLNRVTEREDRETKRKNYDFKITSMNHKSTIKWDERNENLFLGKHQVVAESVPLQPCVHLHQQIVNNSCFCSEISFLDAQRKMFIEIQIDLKIAFVRTIEKNLMRTTLDRAEQAIGSPNGSPTWILIVRSSSLTSEPTRTGVSDFAWSSRIQDALITKHMDISCGSFTCYSPDLLLMTQSSRLHEH